MKILNIGIGMVFCTILVVVWVLAERANPVMLDLENQPAASSDAP